MEIPKKEVVTSALFDFVDLPSIHEYETKTVVLRFVYLNLLK